MCVRCFRNIQWHELLLSDVHLLFQGDSVKYFLDSLDRLGVKVRLHFNMQGLSLFI